MSVKRLEVRVIMMDRRHERPTNSQLRLTRTRIKNPPILGASIVLVLFIGPWLYLHSSWSTTQGNVQATPAATHFPATRVLPGTTQTDDAGVNQVWVPAGCFMIGSDPSIDPLSQPNESGAYQVCFASGYWLDQTEVTNAAYQKFMDADGYKQQIYWSAQGWQWIQSGHISQPRTIQGFDAPNQPRIGVSWYEADAYAHWRGGQLPTEAQWEYAARGPKSPIYTWGNTYSAGAANVDRIIGRTAPVGIYPKSDSWAGAKDMTGNAWEWTASTYGDSGDQRVAKGGSWDSLPSMARAAARIPYSAASRDNEIGFRIASSATKSTVFAGHNEAVTGVAFSPDGKTILASSVDKTMVLFDVQTHSILRTLTSPKGAFTAIAISGDGKTVLTGSQDNTAALWDFSSGTLLHTLSGHTGPVNSVAFSPDGKIALTGGGLGDDTLRLWDTAKGNPLRTFAVGGTWVTGVAYSTDGQSILVTDESGVALIVDATSGKRLQVLTWPLSDSFYFDPTSGVFSPDGKTVVTGGLYDKIGPHPVVLWDAANGNLLRTFYGNTGDVTSVAFSPDGKTVLASGEDGTIRLWNVADGTLLNTLYSLSNVTSIASSPDGKTILTGGGDGLTRLWNTR
ncbi:MAG TPA: SUMF1/EgtB/PvdO family nonheme iron enzyme [Aggregatilineales bacterium]|nr:SUMF1/EgtB/PvdO family nonheme iron enzyme [Aggregatilineales bacterium]